MEKSDMPQDTKVYAFPTLVLAKSMGRTLHELGYDRVLMIGEVGVIDPEGRLPSNARYIVIATDAEIAEYDPGQ